MSPEHDDAERRAEAADDSVEAWLNEHPEARTDLEDLLRLRELAQSVAPPEVDEETWLTVQTRIREATPAVRIERRRPVRPVWAAAMLTAAAAVLGAVLLMRGGGMTDPQSHADEEPFPVVEAADVAIISMDARDVAALVVGEPPIAGEMVFAEPADVRVIRCERCPRSGNVPRLAKGEVPMFVTTVARTDDANDD